MHHQILQHHHKAASAHASAHKMHQHSEEPPESGSQPATHNERPEFHAKQRGSFMSDISDGNMDEGMDLEHTQVNIDDALHSGSNGSNTGRSKTDGSNGGAHAASDSNPPFAADSNVTTAAPTPQVKSILPAGFTPAATKLPSGLGVVRDDSREDLGSDHSPEVRPDEMPSNTSKDGAGVPSDWKAAVVEPVNSACVSPNEITVIDAGVDTVKGGGETAIMESAAKGDTTGRSKGEEASFKVIAGDSPSSNGTARNSGGNPGGSLSTSKLQWRPSLRLMSKKSKSRQIGASDFEASLISKGFLKNEMTEIEVSKTLLLERMVFEETMASNLARCILFFVGFLVMNQVLMFSFPSHKLLPVHQTIESIYGLKTDLPGVATMSDMSDFLNKMATASRYFVPGSSDYVGDPLGRAYLENIVSTPPNVVVRTGNHPQIGYEFTAMVWLKTSVRHGSLMRKETFVGSQKRVCYDFQVEKTSYGGHELDGRLLTAVNPAAASLYSNGQIASTQADWKNSPVKALVEDGAWHHVAILVNATHLQYSHDAKLTEPVKLSRPITDCDDQSTGLVTIGDSEVAAELVNFRWYPRKMLASELVSAYNAGKPLDELVASAGSGYYSDSSSTTLNLGATLTEMRASQMEDVRSLQSDVKVSARDMSRFVKRVVETNGAIVTGSAHGGSGSSSRRLEEEDDEMEDAEHDFNEKKQRKLEKKKPTPPLIFESTPAAELEQVKGGRFEKFLHDGLVKTFLANQVNNPAFAAHVLSAIRKNHRRSVYITDEKTELDALDSEDDDHHVEGRHLSGTVFDCAECNRFLTVSTTTTSTTTDAAITTDVSLNDTNSTAVPTTTSPFATTAASANSTSSSSSSTTDAVTTTTSTTTTKLTTTTTTTTTQVKIESAVSMTLAEDPTPAQIAEIKDPSGPFAETICEAGKKSAASGGEVPKDMNCTVTQIDVVDARRLDESYYHAYGAGGEYNGGVPLGGNFYGYGGDPAYGGDPWSSRNLFGQSNDATSLRRLGGKKVEAKYTLTIPANFVDSVLAAISDPAAQKDLFQNTLSNSLAAKNMISAVVQEMASVAVILKAEEKQVDYYNYARDVDFYDSSVCSNSDETECIDLISQKTFSRMTAEISSTLRDLALLVGKGVTDTRYRIPFCDDRIEKLDGTRIKNAVDCHSLVLNYYYPMAVCFLYAVGEAADGNATGILFPAVPTDMEKWVEFRGNPANSGLENPFRGDDLGCFDTVWDTVSNVTSGSSSAVDFAALGLDKTRVEVAFDSYLVDSFKFGEDAACKQDMLVPDKCARYCNACGRDYSPSQSRILHAVSTKCADAPGYTDWQGESCSWYNVNDRISNPSDPTGEELTCTLYALADTRGNCTMTCNTCDQPATLVNSFDFTLDTKIVPNELNALYDVTLLANERRIAYHDAPRTIAWLCCYMTFPPGFVEASGACGGLADGTFGENIGLYLLESGTYQLCQVQAGGDYSLFCGEVMSMTRTQWTGYGFEGWRPHYAVPGEFVNYEFNEQNLNLYAKTLMPRCLSENNVYTPSAGYRMDQKLFTHASSPLLSAMQRGLETLRSSRVMTRPLIAYGDENVVQLYSESTILTSTKAVSLEQTWFTYDVCSSHEQCGATITDKSKGFPYACQLTADSNTINSLRAPFSGQTSDAYCEPYSDSKRQAMYCSTTCLTGGCGPFGNVWWGAKYTDTTLENTLAPSIKTFLQNNETSAVAGARGFCQPCNGCIKGVNTFDGTPCPTYCTSALAPSPPQMEKSEYKVSIDPDAPGSFTIDVWVKNFGYQYVLEKYISLPEATTATQKGNYPNHKWDGYILSKVELKNVDKYLIGDTAHANYAQCKFDGVYQVIGSDMRFTEPSVGQEVVHVSSGHKLKAVLAKVKQSGSSLSTLHWALITNPDKKVTCDPVFKFGLGMGSRTLYTKGSNKQIEFVASEDKAVAAFPDDSTDHIYAQNGIAETDMAFPIAIGDYADDVKVDPVAGKLACYQWDYDKFCFRNKWYETQMTCIQNSRRHELIADSEWHHYVVVKSSDQKARVRNTDGSLHAVERTDTIELFVDGKSGAMEASSSASTEGSNPVPKWGAMDCSGLMTAGAVVQGGSLDHANHYQTDNIKWDEPAVVAASEDDVTVRTERTKLAESFPMAATLPLGGNGTITAFQFIGVPVPKNAFVHGVYLEVCASDLLANKRFEEMGCTEGTSEVAGAKGVPTGKLASSVTLEVFAVAPTAPALDEYQKQVDPCYLHNLPRVGKSQDWVVDASKWRTDALVHLGPNNTDASIPVNKQCVTRSVDISPVVNEILHHASWKFGNTLTVLVKEKGDTTTCTPSGNGKLAPAIPGVEIVKALQLSATDGGSFCKPLERIKNYLNSAFPLWVQPYEDVNNKGVGQLATLNVDYCLNAECISPTFLGAGADVLFGSRLSQGAKGKLPIFVSSVGSTASNDDNNASLPAGKLGGGRKLKTRNPVIMDVTGVALRNHRRNNVLHDDGAQQLTSERKSGRYTEKTLMTRVHGSEGVIRNLQSTFACTEDNCNKNFASHIMCGEFQISGLTQTGMMYGLKSVSRALSASEIQRTVYRDSGVVSQLKGPVLAVSQEAQALGIAGYPQEVVSVIPPVVLQSRVPTVPCRTLMGDLSPVLDGYLSRQIERKCTSSYNCGANAENSNNFRCVDRESVDRTTAPFFSRTPQEAQGISIEGQVYAEFLDMLTLPLVYRDNTMRSTSEYIDIQTLEVSVLNVLFSPRTRSGTLLEVTFAYDGAGRVTGRYTVKSYAQMSEDVHNIWSALTWFSFIICAVDVVLLIYGVRCNQAMRKQWMGCIKMDNTVPVTAHGLWYKLDKYINKKIPVVGIWDVFDILLRVAIVIYIRVHYDHYRIEDVGIDGATEGSFEQYVKSILAVPWNSTDLSYDDKVKHFFEILNKFTALLDYDITLRSLGFAIVMLSFFRIVVYMRVHPRIAVLYKTMQVAFDDLFHFFVVFMFLFVTCAQMSSWMFGSENSRYGTFGQALQSQFEMMVGAFVFPLDSSEQNYAMLMIFLILFVIIMFFTLMNFFLAIIVDSYAKVKEEVEATEVEQNVLQDMTAIVVYPFLKAYFKWPSRDHLIRELMALDLDQDGINDEEEEGNEEKEAPAVTVEHLMKIPSVGKDGKAFESQDAAEKFLEWMVHTAPPLRTHQEEEEPMLEHSVRFKALKDLDILREKMLDTAIECAENDAIQIDHPSISARLEQRRSQAKDSPKIITVAESEAPSVSVAQVYAMLKEMRNDSRLADIEKKLDRLDESMREIHRDGSVHGEDV